MNRVSLSLRKTSAQRDSLFIKMTIVLPGKENPIENLI
jgi:hypothetical protein